MCLRFLFVAGSSFCTNFCNSTERLGFFSFSSTQCPHHRLTGSLCSLLLFQYSGWSGNSHLEHYWLRCQEHQRMPERASTEWVIKYSGQFTMYWSELVTWLPQSQRKHKSSIQHLSRMRSIRNIRWKPLMSTSEYKPDISYRFRKSENWWGRTFTY